MSKKWAYRAESADLDTLKRLGQQGWELVTITTEKQRSPDYIEFEVHTAWLKKPGAGTYGGGSMKIKKTSWHYRFMLWYTGDREWLLPRNTCSYWLLLPLYLLIVGVFALPLFAWQWLEEKVCKDVEYIE